MLQLLLIENKDANATIFGSLRDTNLMHDRVRQINMFSSVSLFKISFQKKEQFATWLIDHRLIHLHTNLFFSIKFKINFDYLQPYETYVFIQSGTNNTQNVANLGDNWRKVR